MGAIRLKFPSINSHTLLWPALLSFLLDLKAEGNTFRLIGYSSRVICHVNVNMTLDIVAELSTKSEPGRYGNLVAALKAVIGQKANHPFAQMESQACDNQHSHWLVSFIK